MRVLGVDPGLGCTGYGVIERAASKSGQWRSAAITVLEAGVIRPDRKDSLPQRLEHIHGAVSQLIERYRPGVLALEEIYSHYQHPKTAIIMAHARGVICLAAAAGRVKVIGYSARRVKQVTTGTGTATKEQMQRAVQQLLGLLRRPAPHDVADALALALTHIHMQKAAL